MTVEMEWGWVREVAEGEEEHTLIGWIEEALFEGEEVEEGEDTEMTDMMSRMETRRGEDMLLGVEVEGSRDSVHLLLLDEEDLWLREEIEEASEEEEVHPLYTSINLPL